jgi:hypothetical protein
MDGPNTGRFTRQLQLLVDVRAFLGVFRPEPFHRQIHGEELRCCFSVVVTRNVSPSAISMVWIRRSPVNECKSSTVRVERLTGARSIAIGLCPAQAVTVSRSMSTMVENRIVIPSRSSRPQGCSHARMTTGTWPVFLPLLSDSVAPAAPIPCPLRRPGCGGMWRESAWMMAGAAASFESAAEERSRLRHRSNIRSR